MSRVLRTVREALGRSGDFAVGLLIGTGVVTPVFAAPDVTTDDWRTLLMLASIALLGIGLLLKLRRRRVGTVSAPSPAPQQQYRSGIEQYRPQAYH